MTPEDWIREQLRQWRQDLINLSRTNRLLYFKATKSTLDILAPSPTELLQGLTGAGLSIFEPPDRKSDSGDLSAPSESGAPALPHRPLRPREILTDAADRKRLLAALRNLDRRTKQEFMDKGLWVLYLGVGMLEWINVEGDERERVQSPILLVPVDLHHDNPQRPYQVRRADEDIAINPALAAKLEHDFGLTLPAVEEIEDSDPERLFEVVRHLVREHSDWRVTPKVVLGTFSFHKEVMYRDLLDNEEAIIEHLLIRALALKPEESDVDLSFEPLSDDRLDEDAPPEQMLTSRDADASQRKCIVAARDGRSFVMDGPPGTGKSQTIANVIAELLARGQTVLFVSEKAAALEVVHSRLHAAGIAEFALALHSHKTTRREVAIELGRSLTLRPRPSRSLDPFPAHQELVLRRVREAWGVQRAGTRIRAAFDLAIQRLCRIRTVLRDEAGFLSIEGSRPESVRIATGDLKSNRDVVEVPQIELAQAVDLLVRDAGSITEDELTTRVARLFGWSRRGPDIAKALGIVVKAGIHSGSLVLDGAMLTPGKSRA